MANEGSITNWDIFPFRGDLSVKDLDPPVVPEPPRHGEGGVGCGSCTRTDEAFLWTDEHWRISRPAEPSAVPRVMLLSRHHHDLVDLPPAAAVTLGPMLQRVEAAFLATGRVGRMHVNRWGDGGSHFHVWLFARPLGAMQLRGVFLPVWDSVLPSMLQSDWDAFMDEVVTHLG